MTHYLDGLTAKELAACREALPFYRDPNTIPRTPGRCWKCPDDVIRKLRAPWKREVHLLLVVFYMAEEARLERLAG